MQAHEKMSSAQVIANYKLLSTLTVQMREAAEHGKWEELISIEQQCTNLVAAMKPIDAKSTLDEAAHQRKDQLIHKILIDRDQIRQLVQAWMKGLTDQIQSNSQAQSLQKAYRVLAD